MPSHRSACLALTIALALVASAPATYAQQDTATEKQKTSKERKVTFSRQRATAVTTSQPLAAAIDAPYVECEVTVAENVQSLGPTTLTTTLSCFGRAPTGEHFHCTTYAPHAAMVAAALAISPDTHTEIHTFELQGTVPRCLILTVRKRSP